MSEHDATREKRQRLLFKMEKYGMGHPNYHAWEAEYKALGRITDKHRNEIDPHCRVDGRPVEIDTKGRRDWQKPEHINPTQKRGGRI